MNVFQRFSSSNNTLKGRPDYYITPTRDFTQYTKDCEEKYWNKETQFDWNLNVKDNLYDKLCQMNSNEFQRITFMILPMLEDSIDSKILMIQTEGLPIDEDALKDIEECILRDRTSIQNALSVQKPLSNFREAVTKLNDKLEIYNSDLVDLKEQRRLEFYDDGSSVRKFKDELEKELQLQEIKRISEHIHQYKTELKVLEKEYKERVRNEKKVIRRSLDKLQNQILTDLEESKKFVNHILKNNSIPQDTEKVLLIQDLIVKRQLRGLKDLANHSLVVEQSAIAPLTMGIIHYKRHREIQEAMTTFINDEAKHSATFRRFLVEKLKAKEFISGKLIEGANKYMWVSRFLPGTGLFMAVIVEAIGAAYLEFFGMEKYMPDKLFCSICKTISEQDEKRHLDLCVAMYNELFRKGTRLERIRNTITLKTMLKTVYGDKTEDHHLIQAFRAFGVESNLLYDHIVNRLSQQLARISMYVEPNYLLKIIGQDKNSLN